MKTAFVLMALAASAFAMAADPTQQTTLAPAPAQTTQAQGTTVLNAAPGQPSAVTAPNFKPAIVESPKATCGCHQEPTCDCAPKYVAPELKCETSPCGTTVGTPIAQCGCLHLEECACKRDYVAPEIADFHHAPEVVEALPSQCGCNGCAVCPVDTHVAPEIVEPTLPQQCGCTGCNPCAAIQAKAGQPGVTILKPTTTVQ